MYFKKPKTVAMIVAGLSLSVSAQATLSGLYNTGVDTTAGQDNHWQVISPNPPSTQNAFVAVDTGAFPFDPGHWIHNDSTSQWITYSSPLNTGGSPTLDYNYTLTFSGNAGDTFLVRWLSDNGSILTLDGTALGSRDYGLIAPATFSQWNDWLEVTLKTSGTHTFDLVVQNAAQSYDNPTGARVEFAPVPEPSTVCAGVLLLLPFGLSAFRTFRRNR